MTYTKALSLLDGVTATGTGPVRAAGDYDNPTVQVDGAVSGDIIQIEGSNGLPDDNDPDNWPWDQVGDDVTADGVYAIEPGVAYIRANFSDNSGGGTVTAVLSGRASG